MKLFKKTLMALGVAAALGAAGTASAQITIELPDIWKFSPDGGVANSKFVEKILLTGYSHIDNTFDAAPGPGGLGGTFTDKGIMQAGAYIDPFTGLSAPMSNITSSDVYAAWNNLSGDQLVTGTDANIFFRTGTISIFVDDTPTGTLRIQDNTLLGTDDSGSFRNLTNSLTEIARLAVINYDTAVFNTETNSFERSGGSFDLNVGQGDGQFVVWGLMDVLNDHWFNALGEDMDALYDTDFVGYVGDNLAGNGSLQGRTSVDAQQTPFTFRDTTSTDGPGCNDALSDANIGGANCENKDADGAADDSQEDLFELAIAAMFSTATPDLLQILNVGGPLAGGLQDFFVFHVGDFDIQTPVPEPTSLALMGLGLVGLGGAAFRRRKQKA